jgi:predicted metal-dependent hydrolase
VTASEIPAPEGLRRGLILMTRRRFFEAHEVLEDLWRAESGPERTLWKGVVQVAVGLHHAASGNARGAASLLRRGASHLEAFEPARHGIDIRGLRHAAIDWAAGLENAGCRAQPDPSLLPALLGVEEPQEDDT